MPLRGTIKTLEEARRAIQKMKNVNINQLASPPVIGGTDPNEIYGTTIYAETFDTDVAAAAVTLAGTTLAADGTDTNINVTITPKGTGAAIISKVTISDGAIDGTAIGGTTPAAGAFTTVTSKSAIPTYVFRDTDCTDDSINASVIAVATDTGSGTEDIDVIFSQEIAGSLTAFLTADADGSITFGSGRPLVATGGGSLTGTWSDLGSVTTVDINGGTIDATVIGATTPAAATTNSMIVTSATPTYILKDSDCTDSDNNFTIVAAATDTATGAEDIDVTFNQQIAGTLTAFLISDADGNITFGTGRPLVADGGGSLTGTWSDLGTVETVIITGGTITDITDLAVADGGTGASTAALAQDNLNLYDRMDGPLTGLTDPSKYGLAYNATNRQFTITNTGTEVIMTGVMSTPEDEATTAHADTTAEYWLVYESGDTTATVTTTPSLKTQAVVGRVYYLASADGGPLYISFEERHSTEFTAKLHDYLHDAVGARMGTHPLGCTLADYTLTSDTNSDMQFSITAGELFDEDIEHDITALATGSYTVVYRDGADASGIMKWSDVETQPYTAGTYMHYNELNAGTWSRTELINNRYTNLWVMAWLRDDSTRDTFVHLGQEVYTTKLAAQQETLADLSLATSSPETVPLYKITVKGAAGSSSTGKVTFEAVEDLRGKFTGAALGSSVQTLGTMSLQNADAVAITGGAITGITDLAIADGGTGASTAAAARTAFGISGTENIEFVFDGGGSAIATGLGGYLEIGFACTITAVRMLPDQSTTTVVDIWKDTYANYPPIDADSITSATPPTVTAATKSEDETLTGWTVAVAAGDILGFNVDSNNNAEKLTVSLTVTRTFV